MRQAIGIFFFLLSLCLAFEASGMSRESERLLNTAQSEVAAELKLLEQQHRQARNVELSQRLFADDDTIETSELCETDPCTAVAAHD